MTQSSPAPLNLSDLSGRVDVQGFYESHGCVTTGKPTISHREGKEWSCSCFVCGGTDRASFWESGRFCCVRGCRAHCSSPYFFLRDIQGYDHQQALTELGIDQSEIGDSHSQPKTVLPLFMLKDEPPCQKWQEQAHLMCHVWEKVLWSSQGQTARDYLRSRGFKDQTIKAAHLGLCPDWYKAPLEDWGLDASQLNKSDDPQIKVPKGITIPWFVEGNIWKIQIRRPEPGPTGKYYFEILGSSDALYNLDALRPSQPVLLVESELDALSAQQEASDLVECIATGSTAKGRASRWIGKLKQASQVLQAFDIDENRAGERAADEWLKALPNAMRWTPWAHDVNDMLREGQSIHEWIEAGLAMAALEVQEILDIPFPEPMSDVYAEVAEQEAETFLNKIEATPPALQSWPLSQENRLRRMEERIAAFQSRPCAGCGGIDWMVDLDGLLICPCVQRKREENARLVPKPMPIVQKQSSRNYWQH